MTISRNTTIQAYQLRKGGTPARMAILRMIAADSVNNFNPYTRLQPGDWRGARHYTMKDYETSYGHGMYECKDGSWLTFKEGYFRNEQDAHEVLVSYHTGYYTDGNLDGLAIGIVANLSHGRFIAGYRWTDNDERVWYPTVFDNAKDAARMADEHARVFAETEREHDEKREAASKLEDETEGALTRLRECLALRHKTCMTYVRDEARELIEKIRDNRERMSGEFANYV